MIHRIQAGRVFAIFATLSAAAALLPVSALASASPATTAHPPATAAHPLAPGGLTGMVIDGAGRPLARVCVTASPTTPRRPAGAVRAAMTSAGGTFVLPRLPGGFYRLRYRTCRPGGPANSVGSSAGFVTDGHLTTLRPVTLRPPTPAMPGRSAVRRFTLAQLRDHSSTHLPGHPSAQKLGGIAGTVLGPHGRPIKGLCYEVFVPDGFFGASVGANGHYSTGKFVAPGTYKVGFTTQCADSFGPAAGNWAPEWYRAKFRLSDATAVVVKAGQVTRGIGAVMRPGGVISGVVTKPSGHGLSHVCVIAVTPRGDLIQQLTTPRNGRYRFQGLDPGRYNIGFFPDCGSSSPYLTQWWPGQPNPTRHGLITTGFGTTRTHVDARLVLGGTISGVVKFRNRHGKPIKGICVDATLVSNQNTDFSAATNAKGEYAIRGLTAGRYSLIFSPGCNNNGNYIAQNYSRVLAVRLGHVTGNVNAYLQPGAIVTGTVTSKATGARLAGICVTTADGVAQSETGANGTYVMNQIPAETIQVEFFNCANRGNLAPQFYPGRLSVVTATSIKVRPGQVVPGIDAALTAGATISGTLTLASGHKPSDVCTDAIPVDTASLLGGGGAESRKGHYTIEDLPPGEYQVAYDACYGPNIADTWFAQPGQTTAGLATADQAKADQIYVPAGGAVPGIDAVVPLGGSISGTISGPASQQGSFVCPITNNGQNGDFAIATFALQVGDTFSIPGFLPGRYVVEFVPCGGQNLAEQWFNGASRPGLATPVVVRPNRTTFNVDARMEAGGLITGRMVSQATGKPLAGVCVEATGVSQPFFGFGSSDKSGRYVVTGLNTGTYQLTVSSCGRVPVVPRTVGHLRAVQGRTVAGPTLAARTYRSGTITGHVAAAGLPRPATTGVCVSVFSQGGGTSGAGGLVGLLEDSTGTVGPRGFYRITGLVPGKYKVLIGGIDCGSEPVNLVQQWYLNASLMSKATVVTVSPRRTTRLADVTLHRDGSIAGTVTGPEPARKPLAGICVQVTPTGPDGHVLAGATPFLAESAATTGGYLINLVPPGRYLVEFEARCATKGFAAQWWQGAASIGKATLLLVRADRTRTGIDATMTQAPPGR